MQKCLELIKTQDQISKTCSTVDNLFALMIFVNNKKVNLGHLKDLEISRYK